MIAMVVLLALTQAEPPRTVNDQVIGSAEEFRRRGPASICLHSTRFRLDAGETSELDYLGIHNGRIRIKTSRGDLLISEGDAWAEPRRSLRVFDTDTGFVKRAGAGKKTRYLIYAPTDYSSRPTARVWVSGTAISGNERDLKILDRIEVTKEEPKDCDQRFGYGWDFILGEPAK